MTQKRSTAVRSLYPAIQPAAADRRHASRPANDNIDRARSRLLTEFEFERYSSDSPKWQYHQVAQKFQDSPPPPYSSQETSSSSSSQCSSRMAPTAPSITSLSSHLPPPLPLPPPSAAPAPMPNITSFRTPPSSSRIRRPIVNSEYTPLLEDFTRKFMESQRSIPAHIQPPIHASTSQLVPPGLVELCQEQAPYNPNFDSISTDSDMSLSMSEYSVRGNSHDYSDGIRSRLRKLFPRYTSIRWCMSNFILLFTLMSFNLGMIMSPQIFHIIFNLTPSGGNRTNLVDEQTNVNTLPDLVVASFTQALIAAITAGSGLILLYAACKVVSTLRKRFQMSVKYRIHYSNRSPFPWYLITYERIVYETLGEFCARFLSFALTLYLFGVSTLYVLALSDYLEMILSLLAYDHIAQLYCVDRVWYLSHDVVVALWLTAIVLLIFGIGSCRRRNQHSTTLSALRKLAVIIGALTAFYLIAIIVYIFVVASPDSNVYEQTKLFNDQFSNKSITTITSTTASSFNQNTSDNDDDDADDGGDYTFNWQYFTNRNWMLLISSAPLLMMPFHLNELLITLLFASRQKQSMHTDDSVNARRIAAEIAHPGTHSAVFSRPGPSGASFANRRYTQFGSISIAAELAPSDPVPRSSSRPAAEPDYSPPAQADQTYWEHLEHVMLDDTNVADMCTPLIAADTTTTTTTTAAADHIESLSDLFGKPALSFSTVRCLYLLVIFFVCMLNIAINVFAYIFAFDATTDSHNRSADDAQIIAVQYIPEQWRPFVVSISKVNFGKNEISTFDFNFLRNYLHLLENREQRNESQSDNSAQYLLLIAAICLLLKTTAIYLLLTYRALLAHRTLFSSANNRVQQSFSNIATYHHLHSNNNNINNHRQNQQHHHRHNNRSIPATGFCLNSFLFTSPFLIWNLLVLLNALFVEHHNLLLHAILLVIGWIGCLLVFVFPALILLYFAYQSMRKNSFPLAASASYALLSVAFRPLRRPKSAFALALILLVIGLFYLVFWPYAYAKTVTTASASDIDVTKLMSIVPFITHNNSSLMYCLSR